VSAQPTVRIATARDVPRVADALANAFTSDPLYRWMLRGGLRPKQRLRMVFTVETEQYGLPNGGTVWTTSGYDGSLLALPPGAWEMPASITGKETLRWLRASHSARRAVGSDETLTERDRDYGLSADALLAGRH
jgi:hypothetical protein